MRHAYLNVMRTDDVRTDKLIQTDRVLTLLDLLAERHAVYQILHPFRRNIGWTANEPNACSIALYQMLGYAQD